MMHKSEASKEKGSDAPLTYFQSVCPDSCRKVIIKMETRVTVVFRQQKVGVLRLLRCCWKLTAVLSICEIIMVGHPVTVFHQILVMRGSHCCLDVAWTSELALLECVYFDSDFSQMVVLLHGQLYIYVPELLHS